MQSVEHMTVKRKHVSHRPVDHAQQVSAMSELVALVCCNSGIRQGGPGAARDNAGDCLA